MKTNIIFLSLICLSLYGYGQTTFYSEDFTGQDGQGATGPGGSNPSIDLSGVDWTIDVSSGSFADTNDYFRVITLGGNELLEGRDLDTQAIWFSPIIDINNFFDVEFTIEVSESNGLGGNNLEPTDTVAIEYRIDGGAWTEASTNGSFANDYDPTTASQAMLNGSTLELRVIMTNNGGGERMRIDNIEVNGFENCTAFALPFSEDFESGVFPPTCWTSYRGANNLGTINDWTTSPLVANSGTTAAFVEFEAVTGGNAQDWLVTPAIDLGTNQTQLRFFAREQFTVDYNTEYTVRISETSATDISSFTTLQTYTEAQLGNTFNEKTIDLSAYSGIVYVAFVMEQNDGDNWFLDDVSVTDISGCTIPADVSNLSANYSDGNVDLSWALSNCYDEVLVVAREGSAVTAAPSGDGSTYIANANFGGGTELSTNEFIVFQGTGNTVSVSNVDFGNTYHFRVFTRKGTVWSSGVPISINIDYCEVTGDNTFDTSITLVNFGSINNVTGQGSGYDDFTALETTVTRGGTEDLTVNLNTDGNFAVYSYAWIDWNRDGDFDDANETYDLGETINNPDGATTNSPLSITIPNDAALGNTRLRILCQYYFGTIPLNGPCEGSTDGEIEDYTITVLPGTNFVYDNGWSPSDPSGVATSADDITIVNGDATITSATTCNSLTVNAGAGLIVDTGVTLDILNTLVLESTSTSYSSLLLNGTINGDVFYERHVNSAAGTGSTTTNNDLISPPLSGQSFGDFRTENINLVSGTIGGSPAFLFGPFDINSGNYINYQPSNDSETLDAGEGFETGSADNSSFIFSGDVETGAVNVPISIGSSSDWNLVGNPYPSYLNVQDFLNNGNNTALLDENAVGIYGYDGAASDGWTIYTLANTTGTTAVAPGQGFFVRAETNGNLLFNPAMQRTGNTDDFIPGRNAQLTFLKLQLSSGHQRYSTEFYFNANSSLGLDSGYDSEVWGSTPEAFAIYSIAPEDDLQLPLGLQSLHTNDLSEVIIPLGLEASGNRTLRFERIDSQLPQGTEVFLLDLAKETATSLNENSYEVTITNSLSGTGRFYLKFQNATLGTPESNFDTLSIHFLQRNKQIEIAGNLEADAAFRVHDITGKIVLKTALKSGINRQRIDVSNLDNGVYIVQVLNRNGQHTKKMVIH